MYTVKTINGWTKAGMIQVIQDRFTVKSVVRSQCVYRGPNGSKCAVGIFIPDELYRPRMDGTGRIETLLRAFPELRPCMPLQPSALSIFQHVHDTHSQTEGLLKTKLIQWVLDHVVDADSQFSS